MCDLSDWDVAVGRVRTCFGVQGEVKILALCDDPARFGDLTDVCVAFADGRREMARIRRARTAGPDPIIAFEGVTDKEAAERFRHAMLFIRKDMRAELPEDAYYVDDLIGLEVVTTDGRGMGTIEDVLVLPGNDVYVTEHAMIPAVREIVRSVDLGAGRVVVDPPAGLAPDLGI